MTACGFAPLPSISLVDGVGRACCPRPVIDWAGMGMGGIERLAVGIEAELAQRLPRQRKTQRGKLALLVATMLSERSANLMDLAAAVPRSAERVDMRYQWIARLLANPRLDCDAGHAALRRGGDPARLRGRHGGA